MNIAIYCDGGSRGNPGPAAYGCVIKLSGVNGQMSDVALSGYLGHTTNNQAEYQAVIHALKWILDNVSGVKGQVSKVRCYLDSQLVVEQLNGRYKVKNEGLAPLYWQARELIVQLKGIITFTYVPRAQNKQADALVNKVLDHHMKKGFTLLELVVAISIIGVLALSIVPVVRRNKEAARDARRKNDLSAIQSAMELYYAKNNTFPTPVTNLVPEFLSALPVNPYIVNSFFSTNGVNGYYFWIDSSRGYAIVTQLENQNESDTLVPNNPQSTPACVSSTGSIPSIFVSGVCTSTNFGKLYQVGSLK